MAAPQRKLKTAPQKPVKRPDLKVADKPVIKSYNDINLVNWRDYSHLMTGTFWDIKSRDNTNGHSYDYHGNYIPQIAQQFYERFTKKNDVVLDLFFGSGTSGIEAVNMKRRCIGVELKQDMVDYVSEKFTQKQLITDVNIICEDSASDKVKEKVEARLEIMGKDAAQFLVLHPPYADIIKFSDKKEDLSNCETVDEFYDLFQKVAKNGYDLLEKGRYAILIIGDKYAKGEYYPLGSECMRKMCELGFKLKATIVKNIQGNEKAKGKNANLWRYRALFGGFYIFEHEYIYLFQK